jgi:hypothetical protein
MAKQFIKVLADVSCSWHGNPAIYRVFVNDELFAERSWIWKPTQYLEEMLQIEAEPGEYIIKYELVSPDYAKFKVENMRVDFGNAQIYGHTLRIFG